MSEWNRTAWFEMDWLRGIDAGLPSSCLSKPKPMGDFTKLIAWQKAHAFALAVHEAFRSLNTNGAPGLRSQILRAASSIPYNLAEGCAKRSRLELARYADDAYGSGKEVMNDLMKARDLRILPRDVYDRLGPQCDEVCRLCFGLSRKPPRN